MISLPLISLFFITVAILWWLNKEKKPIIGKPIPGPRGIPILGNVLQIGNEQYKRFNEWGEKYGEIFQVKLGNQLAYVISDPKLMREVYAEPDFSGRSFFEGFEMYPNEPLGIIVSEGEHWEVHRRFLLRQLRDFGFGKSSMEQLIMEEVNETISRFSHLQKTQNCVKNAKNVLLNAVVNSLFAIAANKRFKHDDQSILQMMKDGDDITQELMDRAIYFLVPWTRMFLPALKNFEMLRDRNRQFYKNIVDEHKETYTEGNVRDFIDAYLAEMNDQKDNPKSMFYGERAERNLHNLLGDMHVAGSDTTSTTLSWALLYLSKCKGAQEKLQKEINLITGDLRQVSVADRPNMPYTLAVMDEVLRLSSIVPNGIHHVALSSKTFKGYHFPKGVWIFPNMYSIHYNPKIWGDPQNFQPERFLSDDGLKYVRSENVLAFQPGKRQCVGETLARDSFFLFLTNIYQKFSTSYDPNQPEPTWAPKVNFVLSPLPYSLIVKERL